MIERDTRQSFLGERFLTSLDDTKVSVIGLGGGGSVVVNELAHVGFKNYFLCDPDVVEESNLNRLMGATFADAQSRTYKTEVAKRVITGLLPEAKVRVVQSRWQQNIGEVFFKTSDVIFSCLDSFYERSQIEAFARKNAIPLVDIGLTVSKTSQGDFQMMGQVILCHPQGPCLRCYGFITDHNLEVEALNYGVAGIRPQVIWANGVLASIAVGLGVELLSEWTKNAGNSFYKHFDANKLNVFDNLKVEKGKFKPPFKCPHF